MLQAWGVVSTGVSGKGMGWAEVQMGRPDFLGPDSACSREDAGCSGPEGGVGMGCWAGLGGPHVDPSLAIADSVTLTGLQCPCPVSRLGMP